MCFNDKKIGYNRDKYPEKRNIIGKLRSADYIKIKSYKSIIINGLNRFSPFKLLQKDFYFNDFGISKVDVMHLFNYISYSNTPWVVTFETVLPRSIIANSILHASVNDIHVYKKDKNLRESLKRLAHKSCKQIIALSECNLNMQIQLLKHFPEFETRIVKKLTCIHPPQKIFVKTWENKQVSLNNEICFMFVGGQFFGKGGREILTVFQELKRAKDYNFKLIIVSSLTTDTYTSNTSNKNVDEAMDIINQNNDWIEYYKYLPNNKVLDLMKHTHVGMLPTYADTYGYSVLEFQASGCPVISTDVRALPEINNDEVGWLIPVKKHSTGEGFYASNAERREMNKAIKDGLENILIEILENKRIIKVKGVKALERVKNEHSLLIYEAKLKEIYKNTK